LSNLIIFKLEFLCFTVNCLADIFFEHFDVSKSKLEPVVTEFKIYILKTILLISYDNGLKKIKYIILLDLFIILGQFLQIIKYGLINSIFITKIYVYYYSQI